MSKADEKETPGKDAQKAVELDLAQRVHERVVAYLKTQYLWVAIVVMVLAPLLGFIAGGLLENQLFKSTRDKLLADAKTDIDKSVTDAGKHADEAEKRIHDTSEKAREYLDEIRSTRQALDYVLRGTPTGELTVVQKRSAEVEEEVKAFKLRLDNWEIELKKDIPQGLDALRTSGESLRALRDSVERLDALFNSNEAAGALAGAFYKVYEFLGDFELQLFVPQNVRRKDLDAIVASADNLQCKLLFFKYGAEGEQHVLEWVAMKPIIEIVELATNPPQLGKSGTPSGTALRFRWSLPNNPSWWNISEKGPSAIKRIDLQSCSAFSAVKIEIEFPLALEQQQKYLSQCTLSKVGEKLGAPCPGHLRLVANVNRVEIQMQHANTGPVIENPFYGKIETTDGVPGKAAAPGQPEVPEKRGSISLLFNDTSLFQRAASEYVKQLDSGKTHANGKQSNKAVSPSVGLGAVK